MALDSRWKNMLSGRPAAPPPKNPLLGFSGIPVKVFTENGACLFIAAFRPASDGGAHLTWLSGTRASDLRAWTVHPFPASLRGYSSQRQKAFRMDGTLHFVSGSEWRLTQATFFDNGNERRDYRQKTDFDGMVRFVDRKGITAFCQVMDLSAGGACLRVGRPTIVGERLVLSAPPLEEAGIASLTCTVCHNSYDEEGHLLCGVQFDETDAASRDSIERFMKKLRAEGKTPR